MNLKKLARYIALLYHKNKKSSIFIHFTFPEKGENFETSKKECFGWSSRKLVENLLISWYLRRKSFRLVEGDVEMNRTDECGLIKKYLFII